MVMRLYNYISRKTEGFRPLRGKTVGLYTCGPTVYDTAHIGNLRTYVFEDVLRRTLEMAGFRVKHVMNITDVDDKTIARAKERGITQGELTRGYEKAFFADLEKLNIKPAWKYPRATEHVREMIAQIKALMKKGLAYEADGSVYFDISKFKNYGRLSRIEKRQLKAGASASARRDGRVDVDDYAKDAAEDFALWKAKKGGEPSWPSPWGEG
ncbi:MAG: class I tRNA ligase family protein, partial [Candidatus Niyogibacteria bacterium]|nr:class I tRNA ligase family protein [Candidatus Niyogibacteria bacterium]